MRTSKTAMLSSVGFTDAKPKEALSSGSNAVAVSGSLPHEAEFLEAPRFLENECEATSSESFVVSRKHIYSGIGCGCVGN